MIKQATDLFLLSILFFAGSLAVVGAFQQQPNPLGLMQILLWAVLLLMIVGSVLIGVTGKCYCLTVPADTGARGFVFTSIFFLAFLAVAAVFVVWCKFIIARSANSSFEQVFDVQREFPLYSLPLLFIVAITSTCFLLAQHRICYWIGRLDLVRSVENTILKIETFLLFLIVLNSAVVVAAFNGFLDRLTKNEGLHFVGAAVVVVAMAFSICMVIVAIASYGLAAKRVARGIEELAANEETIAVQ